MSHYGSFMLTLTLHRIITMQYNYTNHKALQLLILFFSDRIWKIQNLWMQSRLLLLDWCKCKTRTQSKHHPKRHKHLFQRANIFPRKYGVKDLIEYHPDRQTTWACRLYAYVLVHMHVCMRCSHTNECLHFLQVSEQNSDIRNHDTFICLFQLNFNSFDLFAIS